MYYLLFIFKRLTFIVLNYVYGFIWWWQVCVCARVRMRVHVRMSWSYIQVVVSHLTWCSQQKSPGPLLRSRGLRAVHSPPVPGLRV